MQRTVLYIYTVDLNFTARLVPKQKVKTGKPWALWQGYYIDTIYMLHIPGDVTIPESWEESELSMPVSQISFELHV